MICNNCNFDTSNFVMIDEPDNEKAAALAVKMAKEKNADILMKGNINTASLLQGCITQGEWP
jgi:phosphotransacetylase